jgi:hypothetical protein
MGFSSKDSSEGGAGIQQTVGGISLMVRNRENKKFDNLTVLFYDDEPSSWPGIAWDGQCADRYKLAKDFAFMNELHVELSGVSNSWKLDPPIKLKEHTQPRKWYVVLARCANKDWQQQGFDVEYDIHWHSTGVYDNGMGPHQCVDHGATHTGTVTALGVSVGVFALTTLALALLVRKQRENIKQGRGVRVGQEADN